MGATTPLPSAPAIARAELFTRERFVYEGEALDEALAPGTARRAALDAALAEIEGGARQPSIDWRRRFSLLLGLERLLSDDEPHLADGTVLSAHQVDALSGTLTALLAEAQRNGQPLITSNGSGNGHHAGALDAVQPPSAPRPARDGQEADEGEDHELAAEAAALDADSDEEPQDWQEEGGELDEDVVREAPEDPNADRRCWFEHATGAGKTVAALGFVEASRTCGLRILTHRRNLVDQFLEELRSRGYRDRISPPLLDGEDSADGPVTVETYQWFVRNA